MEWEWIEKFDLGSQIPNNKLGGFMEVMELQKQTWGWAAELSEAPLSFILHLLILNRNELHCADYLLNIIMLFVICS